MSLDASVWARSQVVGKSTAKHVLMVLADRAGAHNNNTCWPSVETISRDTEQNRKTVIDNLKYLQEKGFIVDTGTRKGRTGKVVVYRLIGVQQGHPSSPRNSTKTGTVNKPSATTNKQFQKRNSTENGTVPKTDINSPENGTLNSPKNGTQNLSVEPITEPLTQSTTDQTADRFALDTSNLAVSKPTDNRNRFEMRWDWLPTDSLIDRCRMMGVDLSTMSDEDKEIELGEFKSYWMSAGDKQNQGQWEHKLANRLKHQLARRASADQPTKGDLRAAVTKSIMDVADMDW